MLHLDTLPWGKINGPWKEVILSADLILEQWIIPNDTRIKIKNCQNFGFVTLPADTQDKRGFTIPKRLFKY
jgi:hypothetical protein